MESEAVRGVKSVTEGFVSATIRARFARAWESGSEEEEEGMVSSALSRYL